MFIVYCHLLYICASCVCELMCASQNVGDMPVYLKSSAVATLATSDNIVC